MSDLTEDRLIAIRARLAVATPGPWELNHPTFWAVNDPVLQPYPQGRCYHCATSGVLPERVLVRSGRTCHYHRLERPCLPGDGYDPADTDHTEYYPWRTITSTVTLDIVVGHYDVEDGGVATSRYDAELIAHAPEDLAFLLDEVARLRRLTRLLDDPLDAFTRATSLDPTAYLRAHGWTLVPDDDNDDERTSWRSPDATGWFQAWRAGPLRRDDIERIADLEGRPTLRVLDDLLHPGEPT